MNQLRHFIKSDIRSKNYLSKAGNIEEYGQTEKIKARKQILEGECPSCGSTKIVHMGTHLRHMGAPPYVLHMYKCKNCGDDWEI